MRKVSKAKQKPNAKTRVEAYEALVGSGEIELNSRVLMIQQLIPIGLMAVETVLQEEIRQLAGERYEREGKVKRWGYNAGSVYLGNQKCAIRVPRIRDLELREEVRLRSYEQFQSPQIVDERVFAQVLHGISTRDYEKTAEKVAETFGIGKSSVSKKFIRISAQKLKELNERDLAGEDLIAVFMDGKTFSENEVVVALGITMEGKKKILGMVETHTENYLVCKQFLQQLKDRGLRDENKILFIIDGAKGLRKGIVKVFGKQAFIMRCQWHKRENVIAYLPKEQQELFRRKLQDAYQEKTYEKAKEKLGLIRKELSLLNQSAVTSLEEGLEETLTLHRLEVFDLLGGSLKTTNCIESINSQLERYTHRITYWKNSSQRQRWIATALLEIEPSLRKIRGYKHLPKLRLAMEKKEHEKFLAQAA